MNSPYELAWCVVVVTMGVIEVGCVIYFLWPARPQPDER